MQFVVGPAFARQPAPAATPPAATPATQPAAAATPATAPAPATEPTQTTPAATTAPAAPSNPGSATATVHINSPKPVSLEKRASANSPWEHVCNSPCDVPVSVSDEYQVVGVDLNESKPFILDSSQGDKVTLDVTPGVHKKVVTGSWLLAGGGVLVVGGVVTLLAGSKANAAPGIDGTVTNNSNTDWIFVGTALILGGVIAGLGGGALVLDNSHTKVDGAVGATSDKKTEPVKAQVQVVGQLTPRPTWHEDRGPSLAPSTFLPIVQGTF